MAIPKLAMIPSGYKAGKLYSVLPTSGVGDFTVSRASSATRVNAQGLIETMGNNVPRLDYSNGGCPVLLTEPQSTNLVVQSEVLSAANFSLGGATSASEPITAPDGTTGAYYLQEDSSAGSHSLQKAGYTIVADSISTFSIFVKPKSGSAQRFLRLDVTEGSFTDGGRALFNVDTGEVQLPPLVLGAGSDIKSGVEKFANGWTRCWISVKINPTTTNARWLVYMQNQGTSYNAGYTGDGTSGLYLTNIQYENLAFPTSYIKTEGTTITRAADVVANAGDANTFNSQEGTLFIEVAQNADSLVLGNFTITDGISNSSRVTIRSNDSSNEYLALIQLNGTYTVTIQATVPDITEFNRLAFSYKENDFKFYVNGVLVGTDTDGGVPAVGTYNEFAITSGTPSDSNGFLGKTKQIQIFDTALTDAEMIALTTLKINNYGSKKI